MSTNEMRIKLINYARDTLNRAISETDDFDTFAETMPTASKQEIEAAFDAANGNAVLVKLIDKIYHVVRVLSGDDAMIEPPDDANTRTVSVKIEERDNETRTVTVSALHLFEYLGTWLANACADEPASMPIVIDVHVFAGDNIATYTIFGEND